MSTASFTQLQKRASSILLLLIATFALPSMALAQEQALEPAGIQYASEYKSGETLWLGSPDGKAIHATVVVSDVTGGQVSCQMENSGKDLNISIENLEARQLSIYPDKTTYSDNYENIHISVSGNNTIYEGIYVFGYVAKTMTVTGDGTATLNIPTASFGIVVSSTSSSTDMELSFSGLDTTIDSPQNTGIKVSGGNLRLGSGTLTINDVQNDYGFGILATSHQIGQAYYGGKVLVSSTHKLICTVTHPSTSYAIDAVEMANYPESLAKITGVLPIGATFSADGKTYTLVNVDGGCKALASDRSSSPDTIVYGSIIYKNAISAPSKTKTTPAITSFKSSNSSYVVTNAKKHYVYFKTASKKQSKITIPATIKYGNIKYKVVGISAKAFKDAKAKTVVIKSKNLTKKSVRKCFSSSKVKSIKVPKAKKAAYKKAFTKNNCGKSVKIS